MQPELERGNLGPRETSSTKLQAGFQLLTKTCWDSGQLTSAGRVAARDQLPRRDTWHTWDGRAHSHPENQEAYHQGGDKMHSPPGETALTKYLVV